MEQRGLRYNEGKLRYDLLHPESVKGLVKVLTKGAQKYAERNWEKGMPWGEVLASLERHLNAIKAGEDYDEETGLLHADHVQCNAHFLSAYYKIAPHYDNRPIPAITRPRIALDIDEVLCDWVGDWTNMNGQARPTSWSFDRELLDKFERMKEGGKLDEFYLSLKVLTPPADIPFEPECYITSRPVGSEITEKWLDSNGFPARPVFTTTKERSKVDIAKEQGIQIMVDDGWHNFVALNRAGIFCYLFDAPHNQRYKVGHRRIRSLKEVIL